MKTRVFVLLAVLFIFLLPLLLTSSAQGRKALASLTASQTVFWQSTPAPWPAVADQLKQANVKPGSALEKLVKSNQDFSVLRLSEATDNLKLPPWARVWWRKSHPEGIYSATDPTGGYPPVLKDIVQWMIWHQDLKPGKPDLPARPGGKTDATITGEKRISGAQITPRSGSDIRLNFFDPMKILAAANAIQGSGLQAIFYSTDGGDSWGQTSLPLTGLDAAQFSPTAEWTSDGRAWSSTLGLEGSMTRLRVYFSTNNGANWTLDATPSGTQTAANKQMIWVDHNPGSPFFNRMYAIWHNGPPAFMSRRTAGAGGAWLANPIQVSGGESAGTAFGGDVKTNSAGEVFGLWPTTGNRKIFVVKSTNGGESYGAPIQVATTFDSLDIGVPAFNGLRRPLIYVSAGVYKNATRDMVYATWTDLSGESGCTSESDEPGDTVASPCKTRIWFSRSMDGGAAWSTPIKLNDQAGLNDQFNQRLAVDETTGALAIIYYDTVADAGRKKVHVYYQSSFDSGATWSAAQQVTTAQTDETSGGANTDDQFGNYNGLSGHAGIFFPSWTDRRDGVKEEIWTARISDPACTPPGTPGAPAAAATAPNEITVSWSNGAPGAAKYNVYRAIGTCASPGAFTLVASGVTAANFVDTTVSGGTAYSYKITGLDPTGNCESALSSCSSAMATGACTLPPAFAGLSSVTNPAAATCTLNLTWTAATANCGGPVSYRIYRSTTPGFTPNAGNLIATDNDTSYADTAGLMSGVTYFYIVRAIDDSNSVSDTNAIAQSGAPSGPVMLSALTETFEGALSGGGFDNAGWTHQAAAGPVDWVWSELLSQTPTHSWYSASQEAVADRVLVSPVFGATAGTTLSFWHTFSFEVNGANTIFYDGGTLEYSTNGGMSWTVIPDANFTAGGFNATIHGDTGNPIGGRRGWGGGSIGAMTQVTVNLGTLAGNNVMLRWHAGDDNSTANFGWLVDSVTIANANLPGACATDGGCPAIAIAPSTLPGGGSIGTPYPETTLTAIGGQGPYAFSVSAGALPPGLTLSMAGVISGAPTAGGLFEFTVRVTDANDCMGMRAYSISVECPAIGITPNSLTSGTTGQEYPMTTLTASGGAAPYNFSLMSGALPAGLSLSVAGSISGTPMDVGTFNFTIKATDANGCMGLQNYMLIINCGTVTISPATLPGTQAGLFYTQTLTATPAGGNYTYELTAGALPPGLTLNPNGGELSGTPSVTGNFEFTIRATGFSGACIGTQAYSLTVGCPTISLTPETLPDAQPDVMYSQMITAEPAGGNYVFTLMNGALPAGLALEGSTGVISGTTTQQGMFSFRIRVTGFGSCLGVRDYTLQVGTCPTVTISPESLPNATAGVSYTQTFTQTGATGALTWSVSEGELPSGLTLNPTTGVLQGTPSVFGPFMFTIRVIGENGCPGTRAYTLTVNPPCGAITVSPATLANGFVGVVYNQTLSATGGASPYTFAVSSGTLPAGLILSSGGVLSGTPAATGTSTFTIQATDAKGCTGMRSYTVVISGSGLMFYPLPAPVRLLDTRPGLSPNACSQPDAPITGGTSRTQPARGFCGLPAGAQAITGNITTVQSGGGYLTLYPSDAAQPLVANSNYEPNEILNNVFTVGLGNSDGAFKIFVTTTTDVVIDVTGYYAPPGGGGLFFHPLPKPIRLLETRAGFTGCNTPGTPLPGNTDTTQQARLTCDGVTIPNEARAITGNATTVDPQGTGALFLTLFPADASRPLVANSNYLPGQIMNAPFTVGLSTAGEFKIYPTTQTELVIDVLGYYSSEALDENGVGLLFSPLPKPVRLLETRAGFTGCFAPGAPLLAGSIRTQPARGLCEGETVAADALGIVGNATVVNSNGGYLTFWPSNVAQPLVATSNFTPGQVFNRHFTVGLGASDGAFKIFPQFTTDLVIDVSGYFAP